MSIWELLILINRDQPQCMLRSVVQERSDWYLKPVAGNGMGLALIKL